MLAMFVFVFIGYTWSGADRGMGGVRYEVSCEKCGGGFGFDGDGSSGA